MQCIVFINADIVKSLRITPLKSLKIDPLSANPAKWSSTIKQFVHNSRRIV